MSLLRGTYLIDSANNDAFSRIRVSDPMTLFSVQQQYDSSPIQMESGVTGTGVAVSHDANKRMSLLSVTAGTGTCWMQSYQYIPYQPGKSQFIKMTSVLGAAVAGAVVDFGYGDDDNGIFLRQNGTSGLEIVRRTKTSGAVVEEVVTAANWSELPNFSVDVTKSIIWITDLQFLGMGRVRCGFDYNGEVMYVHHFENANNMDVPYMQTATLPIRMQITSTSTLATKSAYLKCCAVESEGGFIEDYGYPFGTPFVAGTAGNETYVPIISIRPKTTFNSKTNRSQLILVDIDILVTGANSVQYIIATGATFSAAQTYQDVNSQSAFEYGTGGTISTNGTILHTGCAASSTQTKSSLSQSLSLRNPISLDRAGNTRTNGTLTILALGVGGTSGVRCAINYKEIR